jgi:hypothetical protein
METESMYVFEVKYIRESEIEDVRVIELDSQEYEDEKEIYMEAMDRAYEFMDLDEEFKSLELVSL